MKTKIYSIVAGLLLTGSVFAQAPQKMTYQAVVRNGSNALVQSSPVGMKVSILQDSVTGTAVYVETHNTQTNQNGLINIEIGGGTIVSGTYQNGIYWAGGPYFLKTEIDPLGGTNYTITATSELLSVPYSNYSHVSGSLTGYSWIYTGHYNQTNTTQTDPLLFNNTLITYVSANRVMITINSNFYRGNLHAIVLGNNITIPADNAVFYTEIANSYPAISFFGSGTLNGNTLTLAMTLDGDTFPLILVKQ
jgi:hypothetical protein